MARRVFGCAVACLILTTGIVAQQRKQSEIDLQAAIRIETVDGDLKGAIVKYKAIADKYATSDRATAAQALLRLAEAHQKLGNPEARSVYETIERVYADQKDAVAVARKRLGSVTTHPASGGMSSRKVWTGSQVSAVSPDGRLLSYIGQSGNLFVHDLTSGADRLVTGNPMPVTTSQSGAAQSAFSHDASQVAYLWSNSEVRIANLRESGVPKSRVLYRQAEDQEWFVPYEWSPDGKWIAVGAGRKDKTSLLGLVSTVDGSLTVLKSLGWGGADKAAFSPDGRNIAFDAPAADSASAQHDIYVLSVDGRRETAVVVHPSDDVLLGWSPDGTHVLFASDRSGSLGLWAAALENGMARGSAELVKANIESSRSLGVTHDGILYVFTRSRGQGDVEIIPLDPATGKRTSASSRPIQRYVGTNVAPGWSPDGNELAYISSRPDTRRLPSIGVWTRATGQIRELRPLLSYLNLGPGLSWTPDQKALLVVGRDAKGRSGVFTVDAGTGATVALLLGPGDWLGHVPKLSPDGKRLYYRLPDERAARSSILIERDLATGQEREVMHGEFSQNALAPDGHWIATVQVDPTTRQSRLLLTATTGTDTRTLLSVPSPEGLSARPTWTPDGRSVLVMKTGPGQSNRFLLVPVDGGAPKELDVAVPPGGGTFTSINAAGDLAINVSDSDPRHDDVWALENFLSALKAKR